MEALRNRRPSHRKYLILPSSSSGSSQKQENTLWNILRKVSLKVKNSITVKRFKAIILHTKKANSEKFQEPLMDSVTHNSPEDDHTPVDRGIQLEPRCQKLHQNMRMKIYVKMPSDQKTIVFRPKRYDIINDIKAMIHLEEGIQSNQYTLFYGGKLLQDYRTLASLNIGTESTLHMIINPRDVMSIFVKTPSAKIVVIEVKVLYTIRDVKQIVESYIGCPITDCCVIYAGNELQDFNTLAFYNIEDNSTLEVKSSWIQILVKTWSGKTITLDVIRTCTVSDVKDKIFCKVGVPVKHQSIVFAGKRLKDECSLASYNIQKQSTLHMVMVW